MQVSCARSNGDCFTSELNMSVREAGTGAELERTVILGTSVLIIFDCTRISVRMIC